MDYLKAIDVRCSRRKYLDREIPPELVAKLQASIAKYNEAAGLSMQLMLDDGDAFGGLNPTYGMFSGVRNYIALIGKTSDAERLEKEGYYGEKLVLEATAMGLATCWVGTSYNRKKCRCTVAADETLDLVIAIGFSAAKRGFKENMMDNMMHKGAKKLDAIMKCAATPPPWFSRGMAAVSKAPTARNRMPFIFTYDGNDVSVAANGDGERVMVDVGIAKLHFELGAGGGRFDLGDNAKYHRDLS